MAQVGGNTAKNTVGLCPPWKPGQSGNPSGRPRSLALVIRQMTKQGQEIVEFLLDVMRGGDDEFKGSDRLKAADMLLDRGGWPKVEPTQGLDYDDAVPQDIMSKLTDEEIVAFVRIRARLDILSRPGVGSGNPAAIVVKDGNGTNPAPEQIHPPSSGHPTAGTVPQADV